MTDDRDLIEELVEAIHDAVSNGEGTVTRYYIALALKKAGLEVHAAPIVDAAQ